VTFLPASTVTRSWYVPARSTIVCPTLATFTACCTLWNGAALVPAAELFPFGATKREPAGIG
jgi:hypothetical protein